MPRRIKAHIRYIKLRKWFPPDDPLAACVARLCILREDFFLEMMGFEAEEIRQLDANSDKWRRMYFFRNIIRTLIEIRSTIETLQNLQDFKRMMRGQPESKRAEFKNLIREFNSAHKIVKEMRNAIGGHVLQESVQRALDEMDVERAGIFEVGQKLKDTHYKFAGELIVAILLAGVPEKQQAAKLESDLKTIANLFPAFALIEEILAMYAKERGLI